MQPGALSPGMVETLMTGQSEFDVVKQLFPEILITIKGTNSCFGFKDWKQRSNEHMRQIFPFLLAFVFEVTKSLIFFNFLY